MIKRELIELFKDNKWRLLCYKFCKNELDLVDDLYQEWSLVLLEEDESKIDDLVSKNLLELYAYRLLNNMWNSTTSRFYYKYRKKHDIDINRYIDICTDDRSKEQIEVYNELMNMYEKAYQKGKIEADQKVYEMMTRIYVDLGSYREIQKELGINHQTAFRYVSKFRSIVKSCYNKLSMDNDTNT